MTSLSAWKRLRSEREHDYTILKIREDRCLDPHGVERPRVIIDCPDWVNVIALTQEGQVVVIRQFRPGIWRPTLEIPGGMVDPGEDPQAAAIRELEEETGYRPTRVRALGWVHPNPALQGNRCHSFLAEGCVKVHAGALDDGEQIEVDHLARHEVAARILSGEISHALVIAAFHLATLSGQRFAP